MERGREWWKMEILGEMEERLRTGTSSQLLQLIKLSQNSPYCWYLSYLALLEPRVIETDCTREVRLLILSVLTDSDAANCNFYAGKNLLVCPL